MVPLPWCTKVTYGVRYAVSVLVISKYIVLHLSTSFYIVSFAGGALLHVLVLPAGLWYSLVHVPLEK